MLGSDQGYDASLYQQGGGPPSVHSSHGGQNFQQTGN